jgi:hypothetical protein
MKNIHLFTRIILIGIIAIYVLVSSVKAQNNQPYLESSKIRQISLDSYRQALESLKELPEKSCLSIPLGTNYQFIMSSSVNDIKQTSEQEAIGFINSAGIAEAITPKYLANMFNKQIASSYLTAPKQLKNLFQGEVNDSLSQDIFEFDMIVRDRKDKIIYCAAMQNKDNFVRDSLNAVLNVKNIIVQNRNYEDIREITNKLCPYSLEDR